MTEPKPWLREFEIEIEPERVKQKFDEAISYILNEADIPGFRKGHAPRDLVEQKFSRSIESQTANDLIREAYEEAIKEKAIRPLKPGELSDYELTPEKKLKFKFALEVIPEFELKNYLGIAVKKTQPTGFDAEFERRIKALQGRLATYTSLSRPSQTGDYVLCDYTTTDDEGKQIDKKTNVMLLVGDSKNFPELNQEMTGLNPGDEKDVTVQVPADYEPKQFAGRKISYHFGVRSIKEKHIPEVDEEFAQNLGFDNMDALRVGLNEEIMADREKEIRDDLLNQIYNYLLTAHEVEPPPSLVDDAYDTLLSQTGMEESPEVKERLRPIAEKRARFQLVIARIAGQEKIEVSDEERDRIIEDYAVEHKLTPEQIAALKQREGFRYRLLEDKVMSFLLDKAQVS